MALSAEEVRALAQPWMLPVRPDAPAGASARELPVYQRLLDEVAKLQSPSAGAVAWSAVAADSEELLTKHSKDLLAAVYLAHAQQATRGLPGLLAGIALLRTLLETYWDSCFPEPARIRARANALEWFVARTLATLPSFSATPSALADQRDTVEALPAEATALADQARARFEGKGPALGPLVEALERLKQDLPPPAPPPPPPGSAPTASATPSALAAPQGDLTTPEGVQAHARELGMLLVTAGTNVRKSRPEDPLGFRLTRQGFWLAILAPPPSESGGKTRVPAPPPALREKLQKLLANAKWPELLDEVEGSLAQNRLWLDLQRLAAQALAGMGDTAAEARAALVTEVASLLRRVGPDALVKLSFVDGTPLADPVTRAWLEAEVSLAPASGEAKPSSGGADRVAATRDEARVLLSKGKAPEALALLHGLAEQARSGEERFRARLALAELVGASGQLPVSRALYGSLDAESQEHGLDSWNPPLAAQCLEGLLTTMRQGRKSSGTLEPELDALYKRLVRLDPAAAMRLGF